MFSQMFSKERKYFRYRFHLTRVLMVAFLLTSPTQAFTLPGGCAEVLMNPSFAALNDPKFQMNLQDCLQGIFTLFRGTNWKALQAAIPKELKDLIGKIPNLMEKVGPYSKTELVLLSIYLAGRSIELYEEAKHLEIYSRQHQDTFALLKQELAPIIDFIKKDILPQFKIDNTNKAINIKKLSQMLNRYSDALKDLVHSIHDDVKKSTSMETWSAAYGFAAVGVCGFSVFSGNPGVIIITCGVGFGTAAVCYTTCISTGTTLETLDLLWKDTTELRMVIGKYTTILELVQLRDGL